MSQVSLSRSQLYELVWSEPLNKVAERLGTSGPRLSQICDAHAIARPEQGHWLRLEMGKPVTVRALEPAPIGVSDTISIGASKRRKVRASPEAGHGLSDAASMSKVPQRLVRPHPLVAEWIATREQQVRKKEQVYDHRLKRLIEPMPLTPADRRRLRVADSIFKAVEKQGMQVKKGDRGELLMVRGGERFTFQLRYRLKRGQRQLTPDELRWRGADAQKWVYELYETDALVFEIKIWLPRGTRTEWEDSKRATLEQQLDDIIAGIVAAFPALDQLRREREEERRRSEIAARERRERENARRLDAGRFRHLLELASAWREAELAWAFLAALRERLPPGSPPVAGVETADWLAWAERKADEHGRLGSDPGSILDSIAEVTVWTYPGE
ncbi:MAG: hypothetical protein U9R77_15895 [Pseudomonadota bacterium]|uniref:hypothetical protein n=1 Tax=Sphingobium naphthae TaxID=1886786 RepID=UPI002B1A311D|nr:hypothetical protein [Pseudomonadota bacterium]